jgi:hypothetical protein
MMAVQNDLGKKQDPISKITISQRAGGMAQVVEYLLSKKEEAESVLPKVKSWRDAGDTPYRKNH